MLPKNGWIPPEGAILHRSGFYTQTLVHGDLVVGRVIQPEPRVMRDSGHTAETFGVQDAILCIVQLQHMNPGNTFWDGRHLPTCEMFEGSLHLHDQRYNWTSELSDAFDSIHFSFPQSLLQQAIREDGPDHRVDMVAPTFDVERRDTTMLHLARSLMPALARPTEVNCLFADHVVMAAAIHIATTYGAVRALDHGVRPLSKWQQRRVTDYVMANISEDISVQELASICRLSPSYFARAFTAAMGEPPHRFLLGRRVAKAMELMLQTDWPLTEIAICCGFADQSHFIRVFRKATGDSPGRWRRQLN